MSCEFMEPVQERKNNFTNKKTVSFIRKRYIGYCAGKCFATHIQNPIENVNIYIMVSHRPEFTNTAG